MPMFPALLLAACTGEVPVAPVVQDATLEDEAAEEGVFEISGDFVSLSVDYALACAVDEEGKVFCWYDPAGPYGSSCTTPRQDSPASQVVARGWRVCVLTEAGQATCQEIYDATPSIEMEIPDGVYTLIDHDGGSVCGLGENGLACSYDWDCLRSAPVPELEGELASIHMGGAGPGYMCGIETSGRTVCWGALPYSGCTFSEDFGCECPTDVEDGWEEGPYPEYEAGPYTDIDANLCGLLLDGTVECPVGGGSPPAGTFKELGGYGVALGVDGSVAYWNVNDWNVIDPAILATPDRSFKQVASASSLVCGIATDGALLCWGEGVDGLKHCESEVTF